MSDLLNYTYTERKVECHVFSSCGEVSYTYSLTSTYLCSAFTIRLISTDHFDASCIVISEFANDFEKVGVGCVSDDFKPTGIYNFYVEVNLSGCKYLCMSLHNSTCTFVMFLPNTRSCILLPRINISIIDEFSGCRRVEIHRKHRQKGATHSNLKNS